MNKMRLLPMAALLSASLMTGCASKVVNWEHINQEAQRDAAMADESAAKTIQRAQVRIEFGKSEELAYFAPRHLKLAEEQLLKARDMHTSGDPDGEVKPVAMTAQKTLEAGIETKKIVIRTLRKSLKHKEKLEEIKADKYYPEQYQANSAAIVELIDLIEDGKIGEAELGQQELLPKMHKNEVDTIEFIQLQPIKDKLAGIEADGGASVAPASWKTAQNSLNKAIAFISKSPRDKAKIRQLTHDATRAADHARVITDFSNEIIDASSDSAENIALRVERWLYRVNVALKQEDLRHRPFDEQAAKLATEVESLMRKSR
jgi:hypothetical protein